MVCLGNDNPEGENDVTHLLGDDLTFKWKPSKGKSLEWSTEYIQRQKDDLDGGLFSYIQYQFAERWVTSYRHEVLGTTEEDGVTTKKHSLLVGFVPSEFSAIRAEYSNVEQDDEDIDHQILIQFNMSIGAHPAHRY